MKDGEIIQERGFEADGPLSALQARIDIVEAGYVEISAPADTARAGATLSPAAIASLAEAAARLAVSPDAETAELSLHLHGTAAGSGAERLVARGELLRAAPEGRPLAAAQADVFRVDAAGGEALLATALASVLDQN